jgi:hypothetical protein
MNKPLLIIIILISSIQILNSQSSLVTVSITPDTSASSGTAIFHCVISNPTKKKYKYFQFDENCERHWDPRYWRILIKKDSVNYVDCSSEFVLRHSFTDPVVRLYKKSKVTFDFCLNFNKLSPGTDYPLIYKEITLYSDYLSFVQNYTNESYGTYEVQIVYVKSPYDKRNPLNLISNWTRVEYVKM